MLEIAGLSARPEQHRDGVSLVNLLENATANPGRNDLYWHYPHYHRTLPYTAIREGNWKLIEFLEGQPPEMFDLQADPQESTNLATSQPEKVEAMQSKLAAWRRSVDAQMMQPNPDFDPEQAEQKRERQSF